MGRESSLELRQDPVLGSAALALSYRQESRSLPPEVPPSSQELLLHYIELARIGQMDHWELLQTLEIPLPFSLERSLYSLYRKIRTWWESLREAN